ncbi:MAG: glycyl-radical enzyme activating protein [Mailhella sp.]|nr:glycyl-radical enzyme activating protein [Mailhella sp.]
METSMKAIIENIQHFSLHDGPGTRTTVFFKGCPLKCLWCSNPTTQNIKRELIYKKDNCLRCGKCIAVCRQNALSMDTSQKFPIIRIDKNLCTACEECTEHCPADALQTIGNEYDISTLFNIIKKDIVFYQNTNGGVTFSGGEMLMHYRFVSELIKQCKTLNIHTAAETSGFAPYEHVKEILSRLDMCFYDIKHVNDKKHREITGQSNKLIIENLIKILKETTTPITVRLPLIPTINDDEQHLAQYADFLNNLPRDVSFEILPYHRLGSNKYDMMQINYKLTDIAPASKETLSRQVQYVREKLNSIKALCQF